MQRREKPYLEIKGIWKRERKVGRPENSRTICWSKKDTKEIVVDAFDFLLQLPTLFDNE